MAIVAGQLSHDTDAISNLRHILMHPRESLHVVSSIHEWMLIIFFNIYYLTFIKEFKNITLDYPSVNQKTSCFSPHLLIMIFLQIVLRINDDSYTSIDDDIESNISAP